MTFKIYMAACCAAVAFSACSEEDATPARCGTGKDRHHQPEHRQRSSASRPTPDSLHRPPHRRAEHQRSNLHMGGH